MNGKLEVAAHGIAFDITRGAAVEIVGHKYLTGHSATVIEIDGVEVLLPPEEIKECPGIKVTFPDGFVVLHTTTSQEWAEALLARAQVLADEVAAMREP